MGRSSRLKRERRAERQNAPASTPGTPDAAPAQIRLLNPVADNYAQWIIGNALSWEAQAHDALIAADPDAAQSLEPYGGLAEMIAENFKSGPAFDRWQRFRNMVDERRLGNVVNENTHIGQHVVICGAGPTLNQHAAEWCPQGDQVWGCNSALTWLIDKGHKVTHGFTVDQTPAMVAEWVTAPDVEYIVPSTIHPHLTEYLQGKGRHLTWFHNFVGIQRKPVMWPDDNGVNVAVPYEDWLYMMLFPGTIRSGSGLNTVTRAIDVAQWMGFEQITVLGADCCLQLKGEHRNDFEFGSPAHTKWLEENTVMHADGGHALASGATAVTFYAPPGRINEKGWLTKPDLALSAQWLARMARSSNGRIRLIGDTLPNALIDKDEAFMRRLPNFVTADGQLVNMPEG